MIKRRVQSIAIVLSVICFITISVLMVMAFVIQGKREKAYQDATSVIAEMKQNNALLRLFATEGDGYMIVNKNGEAYLEKSNRAGSISTHIFLKNGNHVQLVDGLHTEKCLSPLDIIDTVIKNYTKKEYKHANEVTGSPNDKDKDAFVFRVDGYMKCVEVLNKCTGSGIVTLGAFGANDTSDVSLVVSGYLGINTYVDNSKTSTEIKKQGDVGYGTLVLDIIVNDKAYSVYAISTESLSNDELKLGSEIYRCNVGTTMTSEESEEILNDVMNSMLASSSIVEE